MHPTDARTMRDVHEQHPSPQMQSPSWPMGQHPHLAQVHFQPHPASPLTEGVGMVASPVHYGQYASYLPPIVYSYPAEAQQVWHATQLPAYNRIATVQTEGHYPIDAMFGSHNSYGEYNNSYGNAPYYPPPTNDSFWGNKQQQQNRVNYRNQPDPAIASDSLYGINSYPQQPLDGNVNHIESGISGLNLNHSKQSDEGYGNSTFSGSLGSRKTTSWASIASQPAKSQPKSLKSKMAASGLTGSTSKHLPPTVTMDAMSWDSKNGSMRNAPSGGKSLPPPAVIANSSVPPSQPSVVQSSASSVEDLPSPVIQQQQQLPAFSRPNANQANKENAWATNGNSSSTGSLSTSANSPRASQAPIISSDNPMPKANYNNNNNNHNKGYANEINENYSPNKYANQRNNNNNYSKPIDNHHPYALKNSAHPSAREVPYSPPAGEVEEEEDDDSAAHPVVEKLIVENNYNPKEFDLSPRNARFFIIKSYSEDDVHRSIKYSIWCSTEHGNKRLDTAFRQQEDKGPIYLFYSVNRSGHFCGIAQMMSHVDYNASSGVWAQDKWKGQFQVKWIYVKDVPNDELRHITLENNENKPVTNSRDTQEVPYEKGKKVLSIIHNFDHRTSIFDDFLHYEKKQEEEDLGRKPDASISPPPVNYPKGSNPQFNSGMPPNRDFRGNVSFNKNRSYPDARDSRDGRGDYRNDYRNDYRPERNDYRNERMDRNEYGRDHRERNPEPRNDYRDNHTRDNREYRDYREPPQFGRDQQYFSNPPPSREYTRERNDYKPPDRDQREFRERERFEPREPRNFRDSDRYETGNNPHERQSWRN